MVPASIAIMIERVFLEMTIPLQLTLPTSLSQASKISGNLRKNSQIDTKLSPRLQEYSFTQSQIDASIVS